MKNSLKVDGFFLQPEGSTIVQRYQHFQRTLRGLLDTVTFYAKINDAKRIKYEGMIVYRSYVAHYYGVPIGTIRFDRHGKAHLKRMPKTDDFD